MTTISSILPANTSGYITPATGTSAGTAAPPSVSGVIASFGNTSSSPLTYNAAGLIVSSQTPPAHVTPQAAQADYLAAQSAINQALASLSSGSSSSSSGASSSGASSSATDAFGSNSAINDPLGLLNSLLSPPSTNTATSTPTSSIATNAQNAYLSAQNAVSQSLTSLTA